MRYRGYYYDSETGYYYLQSRYYDPEIGRFINADASHILQLTKDQSSGMNLFADCFNDPVNATDPTGEISYTRLIFEYILRHNMQGAIFLFGRNTVKGALLYMGTQYLRPRYPIANMMYAHGITGNGRYLPVSSQRVIAGTLKYNWEFKSKISNFVKYKRSTQIRRLTGSFAFSGTKDLYYAFQTVSFKLYPR